MSEIILSIVIPAYNCADVLKNAVNSVVKHINNSSEIENITPKNNTTRTKFV